MSLMLSFHVINGPVLLCWLASIIVVCRHRL